MFSQWVLHLRQWTSAYTHNRPKENIHPNHRAKYYHDRQDLWNSSCCYKVSACIDFHYYHLADTVKRNTVQDSELCKNVVTRGYNFGLWQIANSLGLTLLHTLHKNTCCQYPVPPLPLSRSNQSTISVKSDDGGLPSPSGKTICFIFLIFLRRSNQLVA